MTILVIGKDGQLGSQLMVRPNSAGVDIAGAGHQECDIGRLEHIRRVIDRVRPALLINAAAYTNVDGAESNKELAFAVNRDGPGNLAVACREFGTPMIHISTDYVFDGQKTEPYLESDPVNPASVYGKSKAEGEKAASENLERLIILRTSWFYGHKGPNFVKTILRLAGERDELKVVDDQYGCPTTAVDLADAVLKIARRIITGGPVQWGIYHYSGRGKTTWKKFAEAIVESAKPYIPLQVKRILPITTSEYPTPARRPAYSVLNCDLIGSEFGIATMPWRERLAAMIPSMV